MEIECPKCRKANDVKLLAHLTTARKSYYKCSYCIYSFYVNWKKQEANKNDK